MSPNKQEIIVYTDGSCMNNGRADAVGGIGVHFPNKELKDISKIYKHDVCTNQKTELYAILTALRYIKQHLGLSTYMVTIITDSQYSINCITKWANGWIKNGWITKTGSPVLNREYIEILHKYYEHYDIELEHIEAHTGFSDEDSKANAIADKLATDATRRARQEMTNQGRSRTNYRNHRGSKTNSARSTMRSNTRSNTRSDKGNFVVEFVKAKK